MLPSLRLPASTLSKCAVNRRRKSVEVSGPGVPPSAPNTFAKQSSMKVDVSAVVRLSGVIAHMNALTTGMCQPVTDMSVRKLSLLRSSTLHENVRHGFLTDRVSCCAPSALFRDAGKDRAGIRAKSFRLIVTYVQRTEVTCFASAAASVVAIAVVQARAKSEDAGFTRSSVKEILLTRSPEDAKSTRERVTCLLHATHSTSPLSVLEPGDALKELDVPYP